MRFAILGGGTEAYELSSAIRQRGDCEIVARFDADEHSPVIGPSFVSSGNDSWESLLAGTLADAVIIGTAHDVERRADQLRKLVQAAVPMLLVHPACEAIVGFELDMIRQDTGCLMKPFLRGRNSTAIELATRMLASESQSPIGDVKQVALERRLDVIDREPILGQYAKDALILRSIIGKVVQVTALGVDAGQDDYRNLCVQMTSENGIVARWSLGPLADDHRAMLTLVGSTDKGVLRMPEDVKQWAWDAEDLQDGHGTPWRFGDGSEAIDAFVKTILQSDRSRQPDNEWDEACRAVEMAESAQRSIQRKRTINLYDEPHTEESTFKGVMSVGGCLVLLITLVVYIVNGFLDASRLPFLRHASIILGAILVLFLSLQLFKLVFRAESKD